MNETSSPDTVRKISNIQPDDFIWTWKSNRKGIKSSVWLPYFSGAERISKSKRWIAHYNGGDLELDLNKIDLVLFYGASGNLPIELLDDFSQHRIVCMIHRRNLFNPYIFFPATTSDNDDIQTAQVIARANEIRRSYVARNIIHERMKSMNDRFPIFSDYFKELTLARNVEKIRNIEAKATAQFWRQWFGALQLTYVRREQNPVSAALDACSFFISGVILRWVIFHRLMPCHGFLHQPTGYPSLVYDLIEPYRYIFENAVFKTSIELNGDFKRLTTLHRKVEMPFRGRGLCTGYSPVCKAQELTSWCSACTYDLPSR